MRTLYSELDIMRDLFSTDNIVKIMPNVLFRISQVGSLSISSTTPLTMTPSWCANINDHGVGNEIFLPGLV